MADQSFFSLDASPLQLFPKNTIFGRYHKFYLDLNQPHEIDAGFGTFMMVRKKVLDQVVHWDENYFFYP